MFKLSAILLSPTVPPKIDNKSMKLTITQLRKSLNPNYFSLDTQIPHCHLALLKAYSVKSNEIMCFLPMLTYAVLGLPLLSSLLQSKSNHFFLLVHQTVSNANDHIMLDSFPQLLQNPIVSYSTLSSITTQTCSISKHHLNNPHSF